MCKEPVNTPGRSLGDYVPVSDDNVMEKVAEYEDQPNAAHPYRHRARLHAQRRQAVLRVESHNPHRVVLHDKKPISIRARSFSKSGRSVCNSCHCNILYESSGREGKAHEHVPTHRYAHSQKPRPLTTLRHGSHCQARNVLLCLRKMPAYDVNEHFIATSYSTIT